MAGREVVAEEPELRRRSRRHQDDVRIAIRIVVEHAEGAPVLIDTKP